MSQQHRLLRRPADVCAELLQRRIRLKIETHFGGPKEPPKDIFGLAIGLQSSFRHQHHLHPKISSFWSLTLQACCWVQPRRSHAHRLSQRVQAIAIALCLNPSSSSMLPLPAPPIIIQNHYCTAGFAYISMLSVC